MDQLYDLFFNRSMIRLAILDREFHVLQLNSAFKKDLGGETEELSGYFFPDLFVIENKPERGTAELLKEVLQEGKPVRRSGAQVQFQKAGHQVRMDIIAQTIHIRDAKDLIFIAANDITNRRHREERLAVLNFALDHAREAAFLTQEDGKIEYANEEACRMLGYTLTELLGLRVKDIDIHFSPEDWRATWKKTREQKFTLIESEHRHKSGKVFPVEIRSNYFIYNHTGYILDLVRDLSHRRLTERNIAVMTFALNSVKEAAYLILEDSSFQFVNEAACGMLGYEREELAGARFYAVDALSGQKSWGLRWQELKENKNRIFESSHIRKDGTEIPVEINASYFEFQATGYVLALVRDISERKKEEQERGIRLEYFKQMDQINQALHGQQNSEDILREVLESAFSIFQCDCAWLVSPCDPESPGFRIQVGKTAPKYAGLFPVGIDLPMHPAIAYFARILKNKETAITFGEQGQSLPSDLTSTSGIQSSLGMIFHPRGEDRWMFGLHQCSYPRVWSSGEIRLFQEIGRRLRDALERMFSEKMLRRINRELRAVSNCNQVLLRAEDEKTLLQEICRIICEDAGYRMAWVGYAENDEAKSIRPIAWAGHEAGFLTDTERSWSEKTESGRGPAGRAIRTGDIVHIQSYSAEGEQAPFYKAATMRGFHSAIVIPLKEESNSVFGALFIYSEEIDAFTPGEIKLLKDLAHDLAFGVRNLRARREKKENFEKMEKSLETTVLAIATTLEIRDPYTAGHQRQVAQLAGAIAREMGFDDDTVKGIFIASTLHDIGKIWVPAEILSRPGKLTAAEMDIIRTHSEVGYNIIKDIEFPWPVARMVLEHHERMNGSGYPSKLMGENIHMGARIICVADVVESMAAHRPYRPALGIEIALGEIEKNRGILYDTTVADACLNLFRKKNFELQKA